MANDIPISADYTNREYYALKNDLIARVKAKLADQGKNWAGNDPADFGVTLLEAFAYVGDITNYYIDRVANETQLATATNRKNILNIASNYDYRPSGYRQSSLTISIANSATSAKVIPAGTQIQTSVVLTTGANTTASIYQTFSFLNSVTVPASGSTTAVVYHGRLASLEASNAANPLDSSDIAGEFVAYSDGTTSQTYSLLNTQVVDGSVIVYVKNGNSYTSWTEVTHLADYGPTDTVYSTYLDADNNFYIVFGDGISGAVPTIYEPIKVEYTIGGGLEGNISQNGVDGNARTWSKVLVPANSGVTLSDLSLITVSSASAATGGEDPETNDSIRKNAPTAYRTLKRAVTLADFKSLALSISGVGKAAAYSATPGSVVLYVAPYVSSQSSDYYPGFNSLNTLTTADWTTVQSDVTTYFSDKTQIGTSVSVLPPVYVNADIVLQYRNQSQFTDAQIINSLKNGLIYGFGFTNLDFDTVIYPEQVEAALSLIEGISSVKVLKMFRHGGTSARTTLSPAMGEYFVFVENNVSIYPFAALSGLGLSISGMPTFSATTYTYSLTTTSTTFTITPTVADSTSTVTVNGVTVTSGSASGSLSIPVGTTTFPVVVTSSDSTVTKTYSVKVTRS